LNAVAGGGSFFTFPMLLFTGMNPIVANATNTMAIWPGTIASVAAYRREIAANRHRMPMLVTTSFLGSIIGALLLLKTSASTFASLVPYLLLFATLLFTFSGLVMQLLRRWKTVHLNLAGAFIVQMLIAAYGGYFGGGMGIMMLAMLSMMGLTHIHEMNALKTMLSGTINAVAVIIFIAAGIIAWPQAILMMIGAILGGYVGAHCARQIPGEYIRRFVIVVGFALTLYFFIKN
jgi:uncharacterized membrane protein YfcA